MPDHGTGKVLVDAFPPVQRVVAGDEVMQHEPVDLGEVRAILGASCGVLRDGVSLEGAVDRLAELRHDDAGYVAWLVARSALLHPHTVGAHRRIDEQLETAAAQEVPA